jgi:hypothetical protein
MSLIKKKAKEAGAAPPLVTVTLRLLQTYVCARCLFLYPCNRKDQGGRRPPQNLQIRQDRAKDVCR